MQQPASGETFTSIEESQAALRVSIASATELAAQSERLIEQHRATTDRKAESAG